MSNAAMFPSKVHNWVIELRIHQKLNENSQGKGLQNGTPKNSP